MLQYYACTLFPDVLIGIAIGGGILFTVVLISIGAVIYMQRRYTKLLIKKYFESGEMK